MKRFKKVLKIAGITVGLLVVLLVIIGICVPAPTTDKVATTNVSTPAVTITPEQQAANDKADKAQEEADKVNADKAKYKEWVDGQFSIIDGSQIQLVKQVKADLNDSKSFKHIKTTYTDYKTYLIVYMEYSAKNQYNATIQTSVKAKSDYKTNTVTIIPQ